MSTPPDTGHRTGQDTGQDMSADSTADTRPLSAAEAARLVGVHEKTVRRAIASGRLSAVKTDGVFLVQRRDVEVWREGSTKLPRPPAARPARTRTPDTGPDTDTSGHVPGQSADTSPDMSALLRTMLEREQERAARLEDELRETRARLETEVRAGAELQYWRGQADAFRAQATSLAARLEDVETIALESTSAPQPAAPVPGTHTESVFASLLRNFRKTQR